MRGWSGHVRTPCAKRASQAAVGGVGEWAVDTAPRGRGGTCEEPPVPHASPCRYSRITTGTDVGGSMPTSVIAIETYFIGVTSYRTLRSFKLRHSGVTVANGEPPDNTQQQPRAAAHRQTWGCLTSHAEPRGCAHTGPNPPDRQAHSNRSSRVAPAHRTDRRAQVKGARSDHASANRLLCSRGKRLKHTLYVSQQKRTGTL